MCPLPELIISLIFKEMLSNELDFSNPGLWNFLRIESKLYFTPYFSGLFCVCGIYCILKQNTWTICSIGVLFWVRITGFSQQICPMHWLEIGSLYNRWIKKQKEKCKNLLIWKALLTSIIKRTPLLGVFFLLFQFIFSFLLVDGVHGPGERGITFWREFLHGLAAVSLRFLTNLAFP